MDQQQIRKILAEHGLKASQQRILILEYLLDTQSHPTADEIFRTLNASDPVLSMATVYNTLNSFADTGVINALDLKDSETRYDAAQDDHGHFICNACGRIYNVPIKAELLTMELPGYEIEGRALTLRGLCPACRSGSQAT